MQLSQISLALTRPGYGVATAPPPSSGFTALSSSGSSYSVPLAVQNSAGSSYSVGASVLSSSGTSYNPI